MYFHTFHLIYERKREREREAQTNFELKNSAEQEGKGKRIENGRAGKRNIIYSYNMSELLLFCGRARELFHTVSYSQNVYFWAVFLFKFSLSPILERKKKNAAEL